MYDKFLAPTPTTSPADSAEDAIDGPATPLVLIREGKAEHEVELLEVNFAGGRAKTDFEFSVGGLVQMTLEFEEEPISVFVQIVSYNRHSVVAFRLYGLSGRPKEIWESYVASVRGSDAKSNLFSSTY